MEISSLLLTYKFKVKLFYFVKIVLSFYIPIFQKETSSGNRKYIITAKRS